MASENLSALPTHTLPNGDSMRIAVVVSRWNEKVTFRLRDACIQTLMDSKVRAENIFLEHVPGSFELPLAAQWMIQKFNPDAVICLGCIIKGDTYHFELVANAVSDGIMSLNTLGKTPVVMGVLADYNEQQSLDRSGGSKGNKGVEAAFTALQMIELGRRIKD
jgi:6,7-dimethyl-8-ribityllumazine synthase